MNRLWAIVRRVLKWGGILAAGLLISALVVFAIACLVNWRDEPLTTEAQALLESPHDPYPPEDNIYLALIGFDAPRGESPTSAGQARIAHYERRLEAWLRNPAAENPDALLAEDPHSLRFAGAFDFRQPPNSYWDDVPAHRANVEALLRDNLELYQRYLALYRQHVYFETARASPMAPLYFLPRDVRTLFLAHVVMRLRGADAREQQQALADLGADVQLWRAVLVGEGSMISKMIAIAYLHRDEQVLAEAIADPRAPLPLPAREVEALAPLFALDDWDISRAYASEFRVQASVLQQTQDLYDAGWTPPDLPQGSVHRWLNRTLNRISRHFFKIHATENLFAAHIARLTRAAAPGAAHEAAQNPYEPLVTLRTVYNPLGKILAAISASSYQPYPARAWDGAAYQRLVRLSYEIRRQGVSVAGIPAFLAQHPQWSTHPASGLPFLWDEKAATLRVQTLGPAPAGRSFVVHVWQAPAG